MGLRIPIVHPCMRVLNSISRTNIMQVIMDPNCKELKLKSVSNTQLNLHSLTEEQKVALERQDSRTVSSFRSEKFDKEAKKHWDIFYKRNENRFFKDRHWTTREFWELCDTSHDMDCSSKVLAE